MIFGVTQKCELRVSFNISRFIDNFTRINNGEGFPRYIQEICLPELGNKKEDHSGRLLKNFLWWIHNLGFQTFFTQLDRLL